MKGMAATAAELPAATLPAELPALVEDDGIEWPGGVLKYDETATTPISRWAAYIAFRVAGWIFAWSIARVPKWHPWRVFHEGQMALRSEALWELPLRGLLPIGKREPKYITALKLVALAGLAYAALSVTFDLGRFDLLGFDLIHLSFGGTDL